MAYISYRYDRRGVRAIGTHNKQRCEAEKFQKFQRLMKLKILKLFITYQRVMDTILLKY